MGPFVAKLLVVLMMAVTITNDCLATDASPAKITVSLKSGRTFSGVPDRRTNDLELAIRFERGTATAVRMIEWDRIEKILSDGKEITPARLSEMASKSQSATDRRSPIQQNVSSRALRTSEEIAPIRHVQTCLPHLQESQVVRTASFTSHIANWDADVEVDGLLVRLAPLNDLGSLVPVSGTASVELVVARTRDSWMGPTFLGHEFERIGQWSVAVNYQDFRTGAAILKLPFQAIHPQFHGRVSSYGIVHLRFSVPGHGVFEATDDTVVLRHQSPLRDLLEAPSGKQFLPTEMRGR